MREQHETNNHPSTPLRRHRWRLGTRPTVGLPAGLPAVLAVGALVLSGAACASEGDSATESGDSLASQSYDADDGLATDEAEMMTDATQAGAIEGEASDGAEAADGADESMADAEDADDTIAGTEDAEGAFVDTAPPQDDSFDGAVFVDYGQREFVDTAIDPLSTFALDVDHGSYTITRAALESDFLPPPEAIRPEEFVNAFNYDYPHPDEGLALNIDGTESPFTDDPDTELVRVGVSSESIPDDQRPPVALTFVVDTSGSMETPNRLPMVQYSLGVLAESLQDEDTLAIVTYSNDAGIVLPPTPVSDRDTIEDAIDDLGTAGGTNLADGLTTGYELASEAFRADGVNAVVLASDGIANIGTTSSDGVLGELERYADEGISLVTLGYGMEGFNDAMMEQLANDGDGFYAYVDTEREARRLFEEEITSTLVTVARDAKIQVEFDPNLVKEYRLIGYENRGVRDSDFRNDDVDAGEIGAGHESTAIYEIRLVDGAETAPDAELGVAYLRWEDPDNGEVTEVEAPILSGDVGADWNEANESLRLSVATAGFAERLRYSGFDGDTDLEDLAEVADDSDESELADQMRKTSRLLGDS